MWAGSNPAMSLLCPAACPPASPASCSSVCLRGLLSPLVYPIAFLAFHTLATSPHGSLPLQLCSRASAGSDMLPAWLIGVGVACGIGGTELNDCGSCLLTLTPFCSIQFLRNHIYTNNGPELSRQRLVVVWLSELSPAPRRGTGRGGEGPWLPAPFPSPHLHAFLPCRTPDL